MEKKTSIVCICLLALLLIPSSGQSKASKFHSCMHVFFQHIFYDDLIYTLMKYVSVSTKTQTSSSSSRANAIECLKDQDCSYLTCKNPKCICKCHIRKPVRASSPDTNNVPICKFKCPPIPVCRNPTCGCFCSV